MTFDPRFKTLVGIFEHAVEQHGQREVLGTKSNGSWEWITYAEFGRQVSRLRGGLSSAGVARGDRVGIISNNRVEWVVAAYACYSLGAIFVPMYEAQSIHDWEFICRDCEVSAVLVAEGKAAKTARALLQSVPSLRLFAVIGAESSEARVVPSGSGPSAVPEPPHAGGNARVTTYAALLASGAQAPSIIPSPEDVAALVYTSGTTGAPKGVALTHLNFASNVSAVHQIFQFSPDDRSLAFLPWAHVFGQTAELHLLLSFGASLAICEGPDKILENLAEVRPTLLFSVPRVFNRIFTAVQTQLAAKPAIVRRLVAAAVAAAGKERSGKTLTLGERALRKLADRLVFQKVRARFGGRLRLAVSGSAALSREVGEFVDSIGILVLEGYGLTETSPVVSVNYPGARRVGTVGRPVPGVRVRIDPEALTDTSARSRSRSREGDGDEGEIVVYGANVMRGYYRRPDDTAAVFTADGGFRTGDMGRLDADGFLMITGRLKEQYKLENGKYVVPTPLEEQIKLSPYVANAMVYGDNRPYNVALIVANLAALSKWAETENVILPHRVDDLLVHPEVRALYRREIDRVGVRFKPYESIADFVLIENDFTIDNGMLTPKMSVMRRKVLEEHRPRLEILYAKESRRT